MSAPVELSDCNFAYFSEISCKLERGIYGDYEHLLLQLIAVRNHLKEETFRQSLPTVILDVVCQILDCLSKERKFKEQKGEFTDLKNFSELAAETFRLLRNSCAGCIRNQNHISLHEGFLQHTAVICDIVSEIIPESLAKQKDCAFTCLRCLVQFLGNTAVDFPPNQITVWKCFGRKFGYLLQLEDINLSNYTCMVVHSCMGGDSGCIHDLTHEDFGIKLLCQILSHFSSEDCEWGLYIFEKLLSTEDFLKMVYDKLCAEDRETLLNFISAQLKSQEVLQPDVSDRVAVSNTQNKPTNELRLHESNVMFICDMFKEEAHVILRLSQKHSGDELKPVLVTRQLECLCAATSHCEIYTKLLVEQDLVKCAVNLLHCMKLLGEQEDNTFTQVSKLSELHSDDLVHPVFGLKRDLIRLISNMCYKNETNQDLVRELGGIQLILDHTNIDGRNPFITQWAVFAVRNLCEKNLDNQAVIAGMKLEGLADNVEQLRQFGVEAEIQGDKVVIKKVTESEVTHPSPFSKPDTRDL